MTEIKDENSCEVARTFRPSQVRKPAKTAERKNFLYLTKSLVLRKAELNPTTGWKTHRIKDLAPSLKGLEFNYQALVANLKILHGQVIFTETANPMVGFK